jgi:hypothetical protein
VSGLGSPGSWPSEPEAGFGSGLGSVEIGNYFKFIKKRIEAIKSKDLMAVQFGNYTKFHKSFPAPGGPVALSNKKLSPECLVTI